jgi:DNA-binding MarR family transcriptional regulator/GNAT superfamily N-acetyltransferase
MDRVSAVRAFNRFYTRRIGVLRDGLHDTPYGLTESRVIYELAQRNATEVPDLRAELGIDAGYLSRLLARLERDGLIVRERSLWDQRRHLARLTDKGAEAFATLDARATQEVGELLDALPEDEQRRVIAAMGEIRDAFTPADAPRAFVLRAPVPGDLGWIVERHGTLYAREYGWDASFEALVARVVADYAAGHDPAREALWIGELDGDPAGCVMCVAESERTARLRLLLVEPDARGLGVGDRLVEACVGFARGVGYRELVLWTNDVLAAARRIYRRHGFVLVGEKPHRSFGKDLVGQDWRLDLLGPPH